MHTQSAGGVVVNPRGEILVVNQRGQTWSLPKGHIEPGEGALAAAKREIAEESGITDLTLVRSIGSYERYKGTPLGGDDLSERKHMTMFLFTTTQRALKPIDPHNPEARWVPKEKVGELLTHPKDKEFFCAIAEQL